MRHPFVGPIRGAAPPIIQFAFGALPRVQVLGLVDSGSHGVRVDADFAGPLGLNLASLEETTFSAGGNRYAERRTTVALRLGKYSWDAEVSFVENWGYSYQLLGFRGFFDQFRVKIDALREDVTVTPHRQSRPDDR